MFLNLHFFVTTKIHCIKYTTRILNSYIVNLVIFFFHIKYRYKIFTVILRSKLCFIYFHKVGFEIIMQFIKILFFEQCEFTKFA